MSNPFPLHHCPVPNPPNSQVVIRTWVENSWAQNVPFMEVELHGFFRGWVGIIQFKRQNPLSLQASSLIQVPMFPPQWLLEKKKDSCNFRTPKSPLTLTQIYLLLCTNAVAVFVYYGKMDSAWPKYRCHKTLIVWNSYPIKLIFLKCKHMCVYMYACIYGCVCMWMNFS